MAAIIKAFDKNKDSEKKRVKEYKSIISSETKGNTSASMMGNSQMSRWDTSDLEKTKRCLERFIALCKSQNASVQQYTTSTVVSKLTLNSPCVNDGVQVIIEGSADAEAILANLNRQAVRP